MVRSRRLAGRAVVAVLAAVLACAFALTACPAFAVQSEVEGQGAASPEAPPSQDQGALIDTFMAGSEQKQGLAVAISLDGETVAQRSYGSADAAGLRPVDELTAFEWGRCSDLIVWACAMQLAEQGALNLWAPIGGLLPDGVSLPQGYESLAVIDLMNHTSGLDISMNSARTALADRTASVVPAFSLFSVEGEWTPGDIVAYTPFDALLAAAVVESVSGVAFADYVQENILDRLDMEETRFMVGGSPARLERQEGGDSLAEGSQGPASASSPRSATASVFSCYGPVGDMVKLANGLMCAGAGPWVFDGAETADELFSVTRTYPSLGVARFAHGMFSFPFTTGTFGMSGTTSSGFSASVYMDRARGLAVAIAVNQSGRADLTQGITRVLVGRSDASVANASTPANSLWLGTYQDAASPTHGPAKLLTALQRVVVGVNAQGVLTIDGVTATLLGAGVYSADTAIDQDVYRFHVSLERGSEFSRAGSDSYVVPASTLTVEWVLLGGLAVSCLGSLAYLVVAAATWVQGRLVRRGRRVHGQPAAAVLALATCAAGAMMGFGCLQLVEGLPPGTLGAIVAAEGACTAAVLVDLAWIALTRRRGTALWTRRQLGVCAALCLAAVITLLNLVYWEMLP